MSDEALFSALRRASARDEPPPLASATAAALARAALDAARVAPANEAPLPTIPQRSLAQLVAPWVVAAAAAAAVALLWGGPTEAPPPSLDKPAPVAVEPSPSRVETAQGDHVYAGAGARYSWEESVETRGVHLQSGGVLCDVNRGVGQFVVRTHRLTVRVLGTVFSVAEDDEATTVRVYEGRVAITDARGRDVATLEAGDSYSTSSAPGEDPFAERGRALAETRASTTTPSERSRRRPSSPARAPDLDAARRALARGEAEAARAMARRALRTEPDADWRILHGDALRALGRPSDAVVEYEAAAARAPRRAVTIGFRIASTRARDLGDARGALAALDRYRVDAPGSRLAERAASLRIDAVRASGGDVEAASARYLERFPEGPRASALRSRR